MVVGFTSNTVSSNPAHSEVYAIQHYVIKFVGDLLQTDGFSLGTTVSSIHKTDAMIY